MVNPLWLELPMSRTNFHGPRYIRAIEVRLLIQFLGKDIDDILNLNISVLHTNTHVHVYVWSVLSGLANILMMF